MIDINKQYRTRDGREVRIYATDGRAMYPIHGAILQQHGWQQSCWAVDGLHSISSSGNHSGDIIEVRPRHKRTVWVTVWSNGYTETSSKPEWRNGPLGCGQEPISCVKVELDFEEGEGL
jgi:hypothetical protein